MSHVKLDYLLTKGGTGQGHRAGPVCGVVVLGHIR
jgi:hypothetical protein